MSNPARRQPKMAIDEYFRNYGVFQDFLSTNILTFEDLYKSYYDQFRTLIYEIVQIDGLEETPTVDPTFLKYCIFIVGKATFFNTKSGELRALNGTYSGVPDIYYIPELMIVANPRLEESYELERGKECEVVYCREVDRYNLAPFGGLFPLISETATIIADNKISINVAQKNTRLVNLITADTEQSKRSAEAAINAMYAGLPYSVIQSNLVDELHSIPLMPNTTNRYLIDLIELEQYAMSHFLEKIGLYTHDQMKRERLITAEINDNSNLPIFNIYNIIKTINEGFDRVNAMFGTHYRAYLNPLILNQLENLAERKEVAAETEGAEEDEVSNENIEAAADQDGSSDAADQALESASDAATDDNEDSSEPGSSESDRVDEDRDELPPDESEDDDSEGASEKGIDDRADQASEESEDSEDKSGSNDGDNSVEINIDGDISGNPEINIDVKVGDEDEPESVLEEMDGDRRGSSDESADSVRVDPGTDRSDSE
jgi:hypothetical protein